MSSEKELSMENTIMNKVISGEIQMKPRWYFIVGSLVSFIGLIGLILGLTFLTSFSLFLILKRGPGIGRIMLMLDSFPLWIPLLAIVFVIVGMMLLNRYEFSYKKNMLLIVVAVVAAILLSAFAIHTLGLDDIWFNRGPLRRIFSSDYPTGMGKQLQT